MSRNRRIRKARAVRPLFASLIKLSQFSQIQPGMVVRLNRSPDRPWLFWMKPNGVLTCDRGDGFAGLRLRLEEEHNHWIVYQRANCSGNWHKQ